ncbi:MAG: DNA repair protein RecN [Bacteroidota bacterium]|nr:DNA repair protein RecN [Bacteroidota bacterium]
MLENLKISNYAIINEIEIDFAKSLNVITGETGAGKSILLGALALILGNRVDKTALHNQNSKCIIEGVFDIQKLDLQNFFDKNDLDYETQTILRREIVPSGKSRAFINDTPVKLDILKELSEKFIDIHSQHQTIRLNDTSFQLSILDAYSGTKKDLSDYKKLFKEYKKFVQKLELLEVEERKAKKDLDYFNFQLEEIEKSGLEDNENEELEKEFLVLSNAEKIRNNINHILYSVDEDEQNILDKINELKSLFSEISGFDTKIEDFFKRMESVSLELKELSIDLATYKNQVEVDEKRIDEITDRLDLINQLLTKHQFKEVAELNDYANTLRTKIDGITSLEKEISETKNVIESTFGELTEKANLISELRHSHKTSVEEKLVALLQQVGMNNARIEFKLDELEEFNDYGKDRLNIFFSSNTGIPLQPINKVASGGELSRLMLCIKYILVGTALLPTIVFDEIDLGISGEIAIKVGEMLGKLSNNHQVISITHLPQIAAMGKEHFLVYKTTENEQTNTKIKKLNKKEKIGELAKMIGGESAGEKAYQSSKELIKKFS